MKYGILLIPREPFLETALLQVAGSLKYLGNLKTLADLNLGN